MDTKEINRVLGKIEDDLVKVDMGKSYLFYEGLCLSVIKMETEEVKEYTPLKYDQMINMVYDFMGTMDPIFLDKAREVLHKNPEIRVYDRVKIDPKDEKYKNLKENNGALLFKEAGIRLVNNDPNEKRIYLPYKENIDDVYTFCHEIAHLFDFHAQGTRTRQLYAELPPFIVEKQLDKYLIEKGYEDDVLNYRKFRKNDLIESANRELPLVILLNVKKEYGELNYENVKQYIDKRGNIREQFGVNDDNKDWFIDLMVNAVRPSVVKDLDGALKYVAADAISIKISKEYDKDKFIDYLTNLGNKNPVEALDVFGVDLSYNGLVPTMHEYYEGDQKQKSR